MVSSKDEKRLLLYARAEQWCKGCFTALGNVQKNFIVADKTILKDRRVNKVWQRTLLLPLIGLLLFFGMHLSMVSCAPTPRAQATGTSITYGETVHGEVENRFGDEWAFFGGTGERVTITLASNEFDTVLELYGPTYRRWYRRNNNFEGMGTNSALNNYKLPASGYYTIIAAPQENDATGSYTLTLDGITITTFAQ
jgi:hypothetical protein